MIEGEGFQLGQSGSLPRQSGQMRRQHQPASVIQAQQTNEPFPGNGPARLRAGQLGRDVELERLLSQTVETREVARLFHPASQLCGGLGGFVDSFEVSLGRLRLDRLQIGLPRLPGELQQPVGHLQPHRFETAPLELQRRRHRDDAENRKGQRGLVLERIGGACARGAEPRIRQASGLYEVGLGDAQVRELRLQAPVVEKRDLNRVLGCERPRQQSVDFLADGCLLFGRSCPLRTRLQPVLRDLVQTRHAGVGRELRASGEDHRGKGPGDGMQCKPGATESSCRMPRRPTSLP